MVNKKIVFSLMFFLFLSPFIVAAYSDISISEYIPEKFRGSAFTPDTNQLPIANERPFSDQSNESSLIYSNTIKSDIKFATKDSSVSETEILSIPANYAWVRGIAITYNNYSDGNRYMLRGVQVELWEDGVIDTKLETIYSVDRTKDDYGLGNSNYVDKNNIWHSIDDSGYFDFGTVYVGSGKDVFIRVVFIGHDGGDGYDENGTEILAIHDDNVPIGWNIPYYQSRNFHLSSGQTTGIILMDAPQLGSDGLNDDAAHVYYDIFKTFGYFRDVVGYKHGKIDAYIDYGDQTSPGTRFSNGYEIDYNEWNNRYLANNNTDSIIHEYAHSLMYGMYGGRWPYTWDPVFNHAGCVPRNPNSADALGEGWARYVPTVINKDNLYHWGERDGAFDLDNNPATSDCEKDEWTFGGILYDLWDDIGEHKEWLNYMSKTLEFDRSENVSFFYDNLTKRFDHKRNVSIIFANHNVDKCGDLDRDGYKDYNCGGTDCNDNNASVNPGAAERCDNSVDDNCNGVINENCNCVPGQKRSCGSNVGECRNGTQICLVGQWGDCVGGVGPIGEGCPHDGKDNDCDGTMDENYCPGKECYDWDTNVTQTPYSTYIAEVWYGPYCADGQVWRSTDTDGDGYFERYMLVNNTYAIWARCKARSGYTVQDFVDFGGAPRGCYDGLCNSQIERAVWNRTYTQTSDYISYPGMFCVVNGYNWGWAGSDLQIDYGGRIEKYLVLKCGQNSDCRGDEYCYQEIPSNPFSNYCRKRCGDGICQPGENCPQDSQGPEVCDNKDNDCDGQVDEFLTQECGSDIGICKKGTQTCSAGNWGSCNGEIAPSQEICDGLDNNCDGNVDESLQRQCGSSSIGICRVGTETCSYSSWINCNAILPQTEQCNGLDDDCDGAVDEGGVCCPGDMNGDRTVNVFDLAGVGKCYGAAVAGDCIGADLNNDNMIDIFDLAAVGRNFGKVC